MELKVAQRDRDRQKLLDIFSPASTSGFANAINGGAAYRAGAFGGRLTVLHGYLLGILYLSLCPALDAVGVHLPSFGGKLRECEAQSQAFAYKAKV